MPKGTLVKKLKEIASLSLAMTMGIGLPLLLGLFFVTGCKKSSPASEEKPEITFLLASSDTIFANGDSTAITAELRWPSDNEPAVGYRVNFSTNIGTITSVDTTDSNGIATAILKSGAIAGKARVTINCDASNSPWQIPITFVQTSSDSVYIQSLTANPTSIKADGVSTSNITGILKYVSGNPASGLPVTFTATLGSITTYDTTDANGNATATLTSSTDSGTALVEMLYSSLRDTVEVKFTLTDTGTPNVGDTIPASIVLYSIDYPAIGVKGAGGNETSTLLFQIKDKSGYPVSGTHMVDFTIEGGPGGGEYLYPDSAVNGDSALVTTHLNSGTKSGSVRIIATVRGRSVSSAPVKVAISGGPAVQEHFTIAISQLNTYTLWICGTSTTVSAYVGDMYGNPVPDSTVIWFRTNCGIVQPGEGYTVNGVATNTLISCGPWPEADSGFFYLHGETRDGNGNTIVDSAHTLWTSRTILNVAPTTFNIPNAGSENFTIDLSDLYLNPLTEGTVLSVTADPGDVRGDIDLKFPDTQSRAWTQFQFSVWDNEPDTVDARSSKVTISVTSDNGDAKTILYGTIY